VESLLGEEFHRQDLIRGGKKSQKARTVMVAQWIKQQLLFKAISFCFISFPSVFFFFSFYSLHTTVPEHGRIQF